MHTLSPDHPRHPMRVVIQRTGLTPDLLRAWERRYGAVAPGRTDGGQRLYSDRDVERLSLLRRATAAGRNISQVADLPPQELEALVRADESALADRQPAPDGLPDLEPELALALKHVEQFDAVQLEAVTRRVALRLDITAFTDYFAAPLLHRIGDRWHAGQLTVAHEHAATEAIRRVLGWIADTAVRAPDAPGIVCATPAGLMHEIGAMLVAATAATDGWRLVYLGADLPASDIAKAALQAEASVVALSLVFPLDERRLQSELETLRHALPLSVVILAGGSAAPACSGPLTRLGIRVVLSQTALRSVLRTIHVPRKA